MPKFKPAPEAVVALFHAAVADWPDLELGKMWS